MLPSARCATCSASNHQRTSASEGGLAPAYPLASLLRDLAPRSFLPLLTLVLIAGVAVWGPWVSLGLVVVVWRVAGWVA